MENAFPSPPENLVPPRPSFWRRNPLSCSAFLLAFMALAMVVLPELVLRSPEPAGGALGGLLHILAGKPDPAMAAYEARLQNFKIASAAAAIAAAALALAGVAKRERRALALAALGVAAAALVWHYVLIGIVAAAILLALFCFVC